MSTGRQKPIGQGVPKMAMGDVTPIHAFDIDRPPEVGNPPHLDIEATLREMHLTVQMLQHEVEKKGDSSSASLNDDEFITSVARTIERKNMVGKVLMWVAGIVGTIFSAGMAYSVFIGANATDDEVSKSLQRAIIEHNSGNDPDGVNDKGEKLGSHPKMRKSIENLQEDTSQVKKDVAEIKEAQKKSDKRGEYQYEFSKWQSKILECQRTRRCRPPKKPKSLDNLESDIYNGRFE